MRSKDLKMCEKDESTYIPRRKMEGVYEHGVKCSLSLALLQPSFAK